MIDASPRASASTWDRRVGLEGAGWRKVMMWIFIITDGLLFAGFLASYGLARLTALAWPEQSEIFSIGFISAMTFVLISSSATMAIAVAAARTGDRGAAVRALLATLAGAFTSMATASDVLSPDQQTQVAQALEDDAQVMTNTQLEAQLSGQSAEVQDEIISINTDARHLALQIAMLIPLLAGLIGLGNSFRMARLPDIAPAADHGGLIVG